MQQSDKQKLESLLKEFGITHSDNSHYNARMFWTDNSVVLYSGSGNVEGYSDFYCKFEFDEQGKFISVGVWE